MTIVAIAFAAWCGVLGLLFGCPSERGAGIVDARVQMHEADQATRQMQIEADQQAQQLRIEAQLQADLLRATTEQQRIEAQRQADILRAEADQQAQREQTYRAEVLQTATTERLYKAEIEATKRLAMVLRFFTVVLVLAGALYLVIQLADYLVPRRSVVELPPLPSNPQAMDRARFLQASESLQWDVVVDEHGREVGVLYMNDAPQMYLLTGEVSR